jgi:F-type H+-transporting ATPase subunit gamma
MGNLKEIRVRIASVQSTQKITSAMKLVSAAKLRRAQNAIIGLRPYSNKLNEILSNLSSSLENSAEMPLLKARSIEKVVLVVISSNRGLCGGFNSNIVKEVIRVVENRYAKQNQEGNLQLICLGKKAAEQLSKKYNVISVNEEVIETSQFTVISDLAEKLMKQYINKEVDKVEVIYNRFQNAATQYVQSENYLPVENLAAQKENATNIDYIFEPSREELVSELIPKILKLQLYKTLIDSIASEHGARMTSMAKATDNATEILKELKLKYNNARQAAITNELNEIVSGANAMNN